MAPFLYPVKPRNTAGSCVYPLPHGCAVGVYSGWMRSPERSPARACQRGSVVDRRRRLEAEPEAVAADGASSDIAGEGVVGVGNPEGGGRGVRCKEGKRAARAKAEVAVKDVANFRACGRVQNPRLQKLRCLSTSNGEGEQRQIELADWICSYTILDNTCCRPPPLIPLSLHVLPPAPTTTLPSTPSSTLPRHTPLVPLSLHVLPPAPSATPPSTPSSTHCPATRTVLQEKRVAVHTVCHVADNPHAIRAVHRHATVVALVPMDGVAAEPEGLPNPPEFHI
eukprot:365843-Chlamydomonas_euryale.AAC.2